MAGVSNLLISFNRERDSFRTSAIAAGHSSAVILAVNQLCDKLKDLLVEAELQNATLKGRILSLQDALASTDTTSERAPIDIDCNYNADKAVAVPALFSAASGSSTPPGRTRETAQPSHPTHKDNSRRDPPGARTYAEATISVPSPRVKDKSTTETTGQPPTDSTNNNTATRKVTTKKHPRNAGSGLPPAPTPVAGTVLVSSTESTGTKLRSLLTGKLNPTTIGVSVKSVFTGQRQIAVKVATKEQASLLAKTINELNIPDVIAKEPQRKLKSLIILGVPARASPEEVTQALALAADCRPASLRLRTIISANKEAKNPTSRHWVFEAPSQAANRAIKHTRIFLGLDPCLVKARITIQRCYRCQRFGHSQKECKFPTRCAECGGPHDHQPCELPRHCVNCATAIRTLGKKWRPDHSARSPACPSYREAFNNKKEGKDWSIQEGEDLPPTPPAPNPSMTTTPLAQPEVQASTTQDGIMLAAVDPVTVAPVTPVKETSPRKERPNQEDEEDLPASPPPPLLKARRTRILKSPVDEKEHDRTPSPDRPQTAPKEHRYLTRGRSQERVPTINKEAPQIQVPSPVPESQIDLP